MLLNWFQSKHNKWGFFKKYNFLRQLLFENKFEKPEEPERHDKGLKIAIRLKPSF
jgi:hypothetical protein